MKNFLFYMIQQANGTKWLYNDTIINLIDHVEHSIGIKCPIDKEQMVEEFKKVYAELIEKNLNNTTFDSSFGNNMKSIIIENMNKKI